MKNKVQRGDIIELTTPAGGVVSGQAVLVGALFGVAEATYAAGEKGQYDTMGVFDLPKASADSFVEGAKAYWSTANANLTTTASGNTLVAVAVADAAAGATTVRVLLTR